MRLELTTSGTTNQRSNQLSYIRHNLTPPILQYFWPKSQEKFSFFLDSGVHMNKYELYPVLKKLRKSATKHFFKIKLHLQIIFYLFPNLLKYFLFCWGFNGDLKKDERKNKLSEMDFIDFFKCSHTIPHLPRVKTDRLFLWYDNSIETRKYSERLKNEKISICQNKKKSNSYQRERRYIFYYPLHV